MDGEGGWDFKATLGRDAQTGKRLQVTRRGFRTAVEAARARKQLLAGQHRTLNPSQVEVLGELVSTVEIASTLGASRSGRQAVTHGGVSGTGRRAGGGAASGVARTSRYGRGRPDA